MEAHQIGQQLRAVVQSDRQQGRPLDPRRLQAVIDDLCAGSQQELVPPLRFLVLSAAFASAAGMDPPLSDGRQLPRLQNELAQTFAAPLCARLQPLLEGLLGLPARVPDFTAASAGAPPGLAGPSVQPPPPGAFPVSAPAAYSTPVAAPPAAVTAKATGGGASPALISVLAFVSGLLLMAVAGVGWLLWQRQSSVVSPSPAGPDSSPAPAPQTPPPAPAVPATVSTAPAASPAPAAPASDAPAAVDRAVGGVQELYQALSAKDFNQAQALYGGAAADQFDANFFRQFERVTVQDLRTTSQTGSTVNLEGVVTFVWPDGSLQTETRTFSVDTSSTPALITGSEFGRVLRPRG